MWLASVVLVVAAAQALPVTRLGGVPRDVVPPVDGTQANPLGPLPVTRLDDQASADMDGPRRVTLTVSRPMELRDLLMLLVTGTPFSVVTEEGVSGTFVGDLKDLSMRRALEAVLFPRGLDYDIQGTLVRVFSRKASTRVFEVNSVNVRRTWQRGMQSALSVDGRQQPGAAELTSTADADPLDELGRGVQALLSATGRMHIDRTAGLVQVTDFAERLDQIGVYVEAVQLRASRQVRLDARVLEVALNEGASAIDWKAIGSAGLMADLDSLQTAIAQQGTVTLIAAPRVVALNNEPAIMRVGTQSISFESSSIVAQDGSKQRMTRPLAVLEGLTLTVIPQIAADGIVHLSVSPSYAARRSQVKAPDGGSSFPVLRIDEADTVARVRDGETVVLAGFLDTQDVAKPNRGFAGVFGAQAHATLKTELVILLTPTVVAPGPVRARGTGQ
jgi:MSHA biogenesis protein MshL